MIFSLVPSDPQLAFSLIGSTLAEELALSFSFVGSRVDAERYHDVVSALRLEHLLEQAPLTLSGGEAVRASIAMALLRAAPVLVLDDVWDELHHDSITVVRDHLRRWRDSTGGAVLDLNRDSSNVAGSDSYSIGNATFSDDSNRNVERLPFVLDGSCSLDGLATSYAGNSRFSLGPISGDVRAGDIVALTGPNGAGKTTLLRAIAGIVRPNRGLVVASGRTFHSSIGVSSRAALIQFVFQNPDLQLSLKTVEQELSAAAHNLGSSPFGVHPVSRALDLGRILSESPFDQPRSVRRLITVGSALASGAPIVLLDEPTTGLDAQQKQHLGALLREFSRCGGSAIFVSHDLEFVNQVASVEWQLLEGMVAQTLRLR